MITAANRITSEGLHPPIPSEAPEHIQQLLKDCWQLSPSQRPSFEQTCDRIQSWKLEELDPEPQVNPSNVPIPTEYANLKEDSYFTSN